MGMSIRLKRALKRTKRISATNASPQAKIQAWHHCRDRALKEGDKLTADVADNEATAWEELMAYAKSLTQIVAVNWGLHLTDFTIEEISQ